MEDSQSFDPGLITKHRKYIASYASDVEAVEILILNQGILSSTTGVLVSCWIPILYLGILWLRCSDSLDPHT